RYPLYTVVAVLGIVITAIYMLKVIRFGFQGPLSPRWNHLIDTKTLSEKLPFLILLAILILVGCWPSLILKNISSGTQTSIVNIKIN
ncbi:MAG: hypothetical protein KBD53_11015, partial [Candidatus Omnitrophica bacterium]|nr:hypothetical protein [Candidatus Omnitrophota bacterium]